jgi:tetratricopeptide (TPR) repeat protein
LSDHSSRDELSAFLRDDLPAAGTGRPKTHARKIAALLPSDTLNVSRSMPSKAGESEVFEALLAKSWSLRYENPGMMVQYATLAAHLSKSFAARRYGREEVFDLQGRALAELGNAYRVLDQHDLAADALARARYLLEELGSRDETLLIRLCELEATLAADQRQFGYAICLLLKVASFHQRTGDLHLAGRTLIKRGLYVGYAGNPEEALRLIPEALALVDGKRDPGLVYAAVHNQLLFIVDCGRFSEGRTFRARHSWILNRGEGCMNRTRLRWIEGRIEAGLGRPDRAEAACREVKQEFEEFHRSYIASIVALDLAAALLAQQRPQEAHEVVLGASQVFSALRIEREALAAVVVLRTTLEMGKATATLAEDVAAFLRRAIHDPTAKFDIRPL